MSTSPGPRTARLVCESQARRQEPQRTTGPLELRDRGPPLAHQVNQGRMERVRRPHPVAQLDALLLGLLLLGSALGVSPAHLGDDFLVSRRRRPS
jgi:hypothetical protein